MGVKNRSGKYIKFVIYMVIIVLINLAGITLFFRADLTRDKVYSISKASQEVVSTLSEPLTIDVFFTKNLPAPYNNTERYLHDLLEEYAIYGNNFFNYHFYNVSPGEGNTGHDTNENRELAKNYGIYPVQVRNIEKDEIKFQKAYMGLVLIHGDMIERIPTITSTDGLEYKLTTAIQKLNNKISAFLGLPGSIQIKLVLSSSLKKIAPYVRLEKLNELPEKMEEIIKKLNNKTYGKLKYEYLDPTKDPGLEELLKKYNMLNLKWPALSKEKIKPGKGTVGLVIEYGGKGVEIPLVNVLRIPLIGTQYQLVDLDDMEETINKNIESLIDINQDLGYLAGYGTLKLPVFSRPGPVGARNGDMLSHFQTLVSQNYSLRNINLKDGPIPDSLNCLVIARPTKKLTDYELFQIDQFLMKGKNLCIFLDAFKEEMPSQKQSMARGPMYVPLKTGLEKLLDHYGISIKESYVMDENCYKQILPQELGGGERKIYFAPLIKNRFINKNFKFMKNIKGLITAQISPLELNAERIDKNGIKAHKLFSSSEKSWEMASPINLNPMFIQPPKSPDKEQSLPLAYVLEGKFPSYFKDKPLPEKKSENKESEKSGQKKPENKKPGIDLSKIKEEGQSLAKGKPGKIFLMASSEIIKDNMLDVQGRDPNTMFIMNIVDYLNNREEIAAMRSKEQRFNPLRDTKAGTKTFIKTFNIAGLPVLVACFGLLILIYRNSRKKRIHMMFQK